MGIFAERKSEISRLGEDKKKGKYCEREKERKRERVDHMVDRCFLVKVNFSDLFQSEKVRFRRLKDIFVKIGFCQKNFKIKVKISKNGFSYLEESFF